MTVAGRIVLILCVLSNGASGEISVGAAFRGRAGHAASQSAINVEGRARTHVAVATTYVEQAEHVMSIEPGVRVAKPEYMFMDPRSEHGITHVVAAFLMVLFLLLGCWWFTDKEKGNVADTMKRENKEPEMDTYGFAVVSLIRDAQQIALGKQTSLRVSRILAAIGLVLFTTGLQCFIMWYIKTLVIAKWVTDIREDYSDYQDHMYGGHTLLNMNGKHRGQDGYFQPGNFDSLDNDLKERVCNIAFSQPGFFGAVLLIWTLTVIGEIRKMLADMNSLVFRTKTLKTMEHALVDMDLDIPDDDPENRWVVDGLTPIVKFFIMFLVIIPRMAMTLVLLWLGCRFLAATNDFGDMVLNAVALEFVLMLKDLLYLTIVPDRNKREIQHINIRPSSESDHASYWKYLGSFSWLVVAFAWIFFYVFWLQMVLPAYKWDVRGPCTAYIKVRYNDAPTTPAPGF